MRIPTPLNTTKVEAKVAVGKAKYQPADNFIVWKIPRIQGQQECTLTAEADLAMTTHRQPWSRPPIEVDFSVVMFTASGLLVRFLKVFEKSGYQSVKWVRYLSKANGTYQIRVSKTRHRPPAGAVSQLRLRTTQTPLTPAVLVFACMYATNVTSLSSTSGCRVHSEWRQMARW